MNTTRLLYHFIKHHKVDKNNLQRSKHVPPKLRSKYNSTSSESEVDILSNSVFSILSHKDVVKSYSTLLEPISVHPSTFLGISPSIVLTEDVLESRRASAAKKVMQKHGLNNCDRAGLSLERNYNTLLRLQREAGCSVKLKRLSRDGVEWLRRNEHIRPSPGVLEFLNRHGKKVKAQLKSALKNSNANVAPPVRTLQTFDFFACPAPVKTKYVPRSRSQRPATKLSVAEYAEPRKPTQSHKNSFIIQNGKAKLPLGKLKEVELLENNRRKILHPTKLEKNVLTKFNGPDPVKNRSSSNKHRPKHKEKQSKGHRKKAQNVSSSPHEDGMKRVRRISDMHKKVGHDFDTNNNSLRKSLNVTAAGSAQQPTTLLNQFRNSVPVDFPVPNIGNNEAVAPVPPPEPLLLTLKSSATCFSAPPPEFQEGEIMVDVEGVENVIELQDNEQVANGETMIIVFNQQTGAVTQMKISESGQVLEELERGEFPEKEVDAEEDSNQLEEQAAVLQATAQLYETYNSDAEAEEDGYDELPQIEHIHDHDAFKSDYVPGFAEEEASESIEQDQDEKLRQIAGIYQQDLVNKVSIPTGVAVKFSEEQVWQITQIRESTKSEELEIPKVGSKSTHPKIRITVEVEEGEIVDEEEKSEDVLMLIEEEVRPNEDVPKKDDQQNVCLPLSVQMTIPPQKLELSESLQTPPSVVLAADAQHNLHDGDGGNNDESSVPLKKRKLYRLSN